MSALALLTLTPILRAMTELIHASGAHKSSTLIKFLQLLVEWRMSRFSASGLREEQKVVLSYFFASAAHRLLEERVDPNSISGAPCISSIESFCYEFLDSIIKYLFFFIYYRINLNQFSSVPITGGKKDKENTAEGEALVTTLRCYTRREIAWIIRLLSPYRFKSLTSTFLQKSNTYFSHKKEVEAISLYLHAFQRLEFPVETQEGMKETLNFLAETRSLHENFKKTFKSKKNKRSPLEASLCELWCTLFTDLFQRDLASGSHDLIDLEVSLLSSSDELRLKLPSSASLRQTLEAESVDTGGWAEEMKKFGQMQGNLEKKHQPLMHLLNHFNQHTLSRKEEDLHRYHSQLRRKKCGIQWEVNC